jgi:RHS repeat-associated protein
VGVSSILFYDPVERVVATLHPNQTYEKAVLDPWRQESWDVNDTVLESNPAHDPDVGQFFGSLPAADYLPTWFDQRREGGLGKEEQQAAIKTAMHANTPGVAYFDTLGRTFLTIAHNRFERAGVLTEQHLATRTELNIEGNARSVTDALGRVVMHYDYDMLSARLRQVSVDAGTRWMLNDVGGKPLLSWDSRKHRFRYEHDALHRPTKLHSRKGGECEFLAERLVYGEGQVSDQALNLRGKVFRQFDAGGVVTNARYDFKGNLLSGGRQLLEDYKSDVDWSQSPELDKAVYTNSITYDALNRPILLTTPDASVAHPRYNESNLLEGLSVNLGGADEPTVFVTYVNYNAKGQREIIEYGNGVHTHYTYDALTFRLTQLLTRRTQDRARLQDLKYTFDPVGNIVSIRDDAQETVYFRNHVVAPGNEYVYDAIYRLISADGREHVGKAGGPQTGFDDSPRIHQPLPSDGHTLHRYREQYEYDCVGNILRLRHSTQDGNWSRVYSYDGPHPNPANNRLTSTRVGQMDEPYDYDAAGNMTRMPHLPRMDWDFKDQLHVTRRQETTDKRCGTTYYVYDATGKRVRKVTESASGSRKRERIYLGGFEVYREFDSVGVTTLERETLDVMDDKHRIALIETKTIESGKAIAEPDLVIRLQFGNHLESAVLELDEKAAIISYEEYYPYGSTSYEANRSAVDVSRKRYRFTGKERDEETGFYYHVARYYASWLGRWTSCDPLQTPIAASLYAYGACNPLRFLDPDGKAAKDTIAGILSFARSSLGKVRIKDMAEVGDVAKYSSQGASRYANQIARVGRLTEAEHPLAGAALKILNKLFSYRRATTMVIDRAVALAKTPGDLRLIRAVKDGLIDAAEFAARSKANFVKAAATRWAQSGERSVETLVEEAQKIIKVTDEATKETLPMLSKVTSGGASRAAQRGFVTLEMLGSILRVGGVALSGLSAYQFGQDVAAGNVPEAIGSGAGAVAGGFEAYSLATSAAASLGVGGVTAAPAVGAGTAVAAAPVAAVGAAAAGGLAIGATAGVLLEKGLGVSEYTAAIGTKADAAVAKLGGGQGWRTAAGVAATIGATAAVVSTAPISIPAMALDRLTGGHLAQWLGS